VWERDIRRGRRRRRHLAVRPAPHCAVDSRRVERTGIDSNYRRRRGFELSPASRRRTALNQLDRSDHVHQHGVRDELRGHERDELQAALLPRRFAVTIGATLSARTVMAIGWLFMTAASLSSPVGAATLTVTSNRDNGPGSLRQAIQNAAPGDTIQFSVT